MVIRGVDHEFVGVFNCLTIHRSVWRPRFLCKCAVSSFFKLWHPRDGPEMYTSARCSWRQEVVPKRPSPVVAGAHFRQVRQLQKVAQKAIYRPTWQRRQQLSVIYAGHAFALGRRSTEARVSPAHHLSIKSNCCGLLTPQPENCNPQELNPSPESLSLQSPVPGLGVLVKILLIWGLK